MCINICLIVGLYPNDANSWGAVGCHLEHGFWRVGLSNWWRRLWLVLVSSPVPISCLRLVGVFETEGSCFHLRPVTHMFPFFPKTYTQETFDSRTQLLKAVWIHERWQVPGMFSCHTLNWEQLAFEGTSATVISGAGALLWWSARKFWPREESWPQRQHWGYSFAGMTIV